MRLHGRDINPLCRVHVKYSIASPTLNVMIIDFKHEKVIDGSPDCEKMTYDVILKIGGSQLSL